MPQPIRVLVVEDSAFMRHVLCRKIEADPRFKVIATAEDGLDGVEKAVSLKPDVMTLDIEMPVLNGIDALKRIVRSTAVPVIMVSAQTQAGARATLDALALGAVDFVPKANGAPFIHEKLAAAALSRAATVKPTSEAAATIRPGRDQRARPGPAHTAPTPAKEPEGRPAKSAPRSGSTLLRLANDVGSVSPRIIVIGSSTGGPQALESILRQCPAEFPVPIVVAQHMPPTFTAALAERLHAGCPPRIVEAKHGDTLRAGTVYIAPGGMQMRVSGSAIDIAADAGESFYKPSVSVLSASAFAACGSATMGIMLTGIGADGAKEFAAIRNAGGWTIAQDQETCAVYGMPRSVIEADGASEVLPLPAIGYRLRDILSRLR
jgi:two-component system chemotaxis response regulator CheB